MAQLTHNFNFPLPPLVLGPVATSSDEAVKRSGFDEWEGSSPSHSESVSPLAGTFPVLTLFCYPIPPLIPPTVYFKQLTESRQVLLAIGFPPFEPTLPGILPLVSIGPRLPGISSRR